MKVVNQVVQTNNHSKFKRILGNRGVNKLHVKRLKESFRQGYLMSPIIVNENLEIIDGQHRFTAAKELGIPVYYIVAEGYGLDEVKKLNKNTSNWGKKEHLHAYVELGYPAYIQFQNFMDDYPDFSIASCEVLLTNKARSSHSMSHPSLITKTNKKGAYTKRYFQDGELHIDDYGLACENAEKLLMIKPYYDGYSRVVFVRAMVGIFKLNHYSHDQLISRLESNPGSLQHCSNVSQYKLNIEEIYNFRSRNKVSLRY